MPARVAAQVGVAAGQLAAVSAAVLALTTFLPGDTADVVLGPLATVAQIEQLRGQLGLDRPSACCWWCFSPCRWAGCRPRPPGRPACPGSARRCSCCRSRCRRPTSWACSPGRSGSVVEADAAEHVAHLRRLGLGERTVLLRHVLPAGVVPSVQQFARTVDGLLGRVLVVERCSRCRESGRGSSPRCRPGTCRWCRSTRCCSRSRRSGSISSPTWPPPASVPRAERLAGRHSTRRRCRSSRAPPDAGAGGPGVWCSWSVRCCCSSRSRRRRRDRSSSRCSASRRLVPPSR
jgi:hypothetical protein